MSGGFNVEVAEDVKQDLYCVICLNLMKNVMQLQWGHGMCKICLEDLETSSRERGLDFVCPTCRKLINNNNVSIE